MSPFEVGKSPTLFGYVGCVKPLVGCIRTKSPPDEWKHILGKQAGRDFGHETIAVSKNENSLWLHLLGLIISRPWG